MPLSPSFQVDFEESLIQLRFCVKPNVDTELDKSELLLFFGAGGHVIGGRAESSAWTS